MLQKDISVLTFISSESCNLNCSYCGLAKSSRKEHLPEAKKVKAALADGSFLNNFKKGLERLHSSPERIVTVTLWGQEPTLTLDEFTSNLPEMFKYFPNFRNSFFSTNFVAFHDRILNYINTINDLCSLYDRPFDIQIQVSLDGIEATTKNRRIDGNILVENIKNFYHKLSGITLNPKVKLSIHYHNVITIGLAKELNTIDKVVNYWQDLDNLCYDLYKEFNSKNHPNIRICRSFSPGIENPVTECTVDDSLAFKDFLSRSAIGCRPWKFNFDGTFAYEGVPCQLTPHMERRVNVGSINSDHDDILDIIYSMCQAEYPKPDYIKSLSNEIFCSAGYNELKMRYDGTLIHCQNVLYHLKETDVFNDDMQGISRKSLVDHHYYVNLLTDSDELLERYFYQSKLFIESGFPMLFVETVNIMNLLAEAGQIHREYLRDNEKLLRHAFLLAGCLPCMDNSVSETGSMMGKSITSIKFFCNGLLDEILKNLR